MTSRLNLTRRKSLNISLDNFVRTFRMKPEGSSPLIISPSVDGVDLINWGRESLESIQTELLQYGAILFSGFSINNADQFEQFINILSPELLEYNERSSPRRQVKGNIYTSTDYPSNQSIYFHNENSYQKNWPMKISFFCETSADIGGETPIADTRRVLQRLNSHILESFKERGCMYVRNYDAALGLNWQTVFRTTDKCLVESYCNNAGLSYEWRSDDRLRTKAVRPAISIHPLTGEEVWFNHIAFFHISTLESTIREGLLATMDEQDLPANSYYGDGSPIDSEILDEIREAYRIETCIFPWNNGDILMLDNMLMAHSRTPYAGARRILVAMSESFDLSQR